MSLSDAERLRLLAPRPGRLRAVLDTDTYNEIDDQFALVQALLSPDRLDLQAIYAAPFFNKRAESPGHGMELSYGEILELLGRMGVAAEGFRVPRRHRLCRPRQTAREAPRSTTSSRGPRRRRTIRRRHRHRSHSNVASALPRRPTSSTASWWSGWAIAMAAPASSISGRTSAAPRCCSTAACRWCWSEHGRHSHLHSSVPEIERHASRTANRALPRDAVGNIPTTIPAGPRRSGTWRRGLSAGRLDAERAGPTPILTDQTTFSIDRRRHAMRYVTYVDRAHRARLHRQLAARE